MPDLAAPYAELSLQSNSERIDSARTEAVSRRCYANSSSMAQRRRAGLTDCVTRCHGNERDVTFNSIVAGI
jgi:hypothetical protein